MAPRQDGRIDEESSAMDIIEVRALRPATVDGPQQPLPGVQELTQTDTATDLRWNVVVWDDPVNLMNYVVFVFQKLFGFPRELATTKMLEVHRLGRSLVTTVDREMAEFYVLRLHGYGLQATMERSE